MGTLRTSCKFSSFTRMSETRMSAGEYTVGDTPSEQSCVKAERQEVRLRGGERRALVSAGVVPAQWEGG